MLAILLALCGPVPCEVGKPEEESVAVARLRLTGYGAKDMLDVNWPLEGSACGLLVTPPITLNGKPATVGEVYAHWQAMTYPWLSLTLRRGPGSDRVYEFRDARPAKPCECGGNPKAPACRCGPKCDCKYDPYGYDNYAKFRAAMGRPGFRGVLYLGVPDESVGTYQPHLWAPSGWPDLPGFADGVYDCWFDAKKGEPVIERRPDPPPPMIPLRNATPWHVQGPPPTYRLAPT